MRYSDMLIKEMKTRARSRGDSMLAPVELQVGGRIVSVHVALLYQDGLACPLPAPSWVQSQNVQNVFRHHPPAVVADERRSQRLE